mmetsp:Transcript_131721/g.367198  ORF Transcript_131721/g.367198 Transcript_131721/m.367198 type:complete len:311 (+) Transcript_131721:1116-2048(+)
MHGPRRRPSKTSTRASWLGTWTWGAGCRLPTTSSGLRCATQRTLGSTSTSASSSLAESRGAKCTQRVTTWPTMSCARKTARPSAQTTRSTMRSPTTPGIAGTCARASLGASSTASGGPTGAGSQSGAAPRLPTEPTTFPSTKSWSQCSHRQTAARGALAAGQMPRTTRTPTTSSSPGRHRWTSALGIVWRPPAARASSTAERGSAVRSGRGPAGSVPRGRLQATHACESCRCSARWTAVQIELAEAQVPGTLTVATTPSRRARSRSRSARKSAGRRPVAWAWSRTRTAAARCGRAQRASVPPRRSGTRPA